MKKHRIKVEKTGIGYKLTLSYKWLFMWLPDTVSHIKQGYEERVDKQINDWIEHFNIPFENVIMPEEHSVQFQQQLLENSN